MKLITKIKKHFVDLSQDKYLMMILALHFFLAVCHFCHSYMSDIQYHGDLRFAGCVVIALLILFFGRKGMAFGFVIYACSLIFVNTFYNYGSIFLMLIAFGAYPKIRVPSIVLYSICVVISFSLQKLLAFSVAIHFLYLILFWLCTKYVYKVNASKTLNLKDDEIYILSELAKGKMQKEIDGYSQQTITAKLKNARERNMCETTGELLSIFKSETDFN